MNRLVPLATVALIVAGAMTPAATDAQSATVSVAQERVMPSAIKPAPAVVATTRRVPVSTACGPTRVCTAAWDLRLVGLRLDDSTAAPSGTFATRFAIENRGRAQSEASEVRLCVASGAQCIGEVSELVVPSLASGERLEVTQPVAAYNGRDVAPPYTVLVRIDPDHATAEANRTNNDLSVRVVVDTAAAVIESFDVPASLRGGAAQLPVTLVVRNTSRAATSTPSSLQLGGECWAGTKVWGDVATRVKVPALGPGEAWNATVSVRHPNALTGGTYDGACFITVQPSPAANNSGREGILRRPYTLQAVK